MLETMTLPSHSPTPTQTPATWTLASDPVVEAELQQQLRETRELESLSCCIDLPEDDADDATYDAQDTNEDADDDDAKLSTHTIVNVPHCPNILIMNNPTIPSNCETKSNNCQEKISVRDQKNILVTSSCPQSNHVPFPLFCYFPSPLLKLIKPSQTRDKLRKKKERIPARKLLYYTKEMGYYRQCFHPRFKYPHSCWELIQCRGSDFLLVFIGLLNILLLQFVLVVLMFFSQEEINNNFYEQ